jgi:hypothetical protein
MMIRLLKFFVLAGVFGMLVWGIYGLTVDRKAMQKEVDELGVKVKNLEEENKSLADSIDYFKNPENLIKEMKSQFNYHEVGEKLIITVPTSAGTSTTR